jgi:hypothetical protein
MTELAMLENRARDRVAGSSEHLRGRVDTSDLMTALHQVTRMPTGPASSVERLAGRKLVDDSPNGWLLDGDERVPRLVVGRRPPRVAFCHVELRDVGSHGEGLSLRVAHDPPDLGDSLVSRFVASGEEAAKQR